MLLVMPDTPNTCLPVPLALSRTQGMRIVGVYVAI